MLTVIRIFGRLYRPPLMNTFAAYLRMDIFWKYFLLLQFCCLRFPGKDLFLVAVWAEKTCRMVNGI